MLVVIHDAFAAFFRVHDFAVLDAHGEWIAAVVRHFMRAVTDVLFTCRRRALGICTGDGTEHHAGQCANQQQCLAKTE